MAVCFYTGDTGDYIERVVDRINTAVDADLGPLTAGVLATALVNPGDWRGDRAEILLRRAFAESKAAHDGELADAVVSTLVKQHDTLLGLAH